MRLVALVSSPDHVCCRYRVAAFRPWLELAGHTLELVPLPKGWPQRWLLFGRLRGANVLLQRQLLPPWQLARLRACVARLMFDFDDAVFLRDSYSAKGLHHAGRLRRFVATLRACDAVIAGNNFLAEHAALYAEPERVHVVPTSVDETRYEAGQGGDGMEMVWIGSSSTLQGIESVAPMLERLGQSIPGLRLKVVCDRFPEFRQLPIVRRPWSEAAEAGELVSADVGISWVPDDLWSRGKCGLKLLQYMAAGLPVIANPVGVHSEIVTHGETGFLASSPEEWRVAALKLCDDAELRRRMGRAGRQRVEARYSVSVAAGRWLDVLSRLERAPKLGVGRAT